MYARTREEIFPSLKKFSKVAEKNKDAEASGLRLLKTYTEIDDADQKEVEADQ